LCPQSLTGCQPHRHRTSAFDDVIVRDDVARGIPDEARARLRWAALVLGVRGIERGAPRHDLHDGRGDPLEQLDRRPLELGQAAARRDRARGRGREQQAVDIGLADIDPEHDQQRNNKKLREAVAHRRPLSWVMVLSA
jgi:hypothetical protein